VIALFAALILAAAAALAMPSTVFAQSVIAKDLEPKTR
jgi:hypothetical protein